MEKIRRCGILLLPGYSMLAAAGVLEALQLAGEIQDDARYCALLLSESGGAVAAEGGAGLVTEALRRRTADNVTAVVVWL